MEITKSMYELAKALCQEYENNLKKEKQAFQPLKAVNGVLYTYMNEQGEVIDVFEKEYWDNNKTQLSKEAISLALKEPKQYSTEINLCYSLCVKQFTDDLKPKTQRQKEKWMDCIEKLNRIDGLHVNDISTIVKNAREDDFWSRNFLSICKLRNKNKDGVAYWKVFKERFKDIQPIKKMNAGELLMKKHGIS